MKVVLTQAVARLGGIGETHEVRTGYAKNYLLPNKLAVLTNDSRARTYRRERRAATLKLLETKTVIKELALQWQGTEVTIKAKASPDGTLYGSVGTKEILKALGRKDVALTIEEAIKQTGHHTLKAVFPDGTAITLTVTVVAEG